MKRIGLLLAILASLGLFLSAPGAWAQFSGTVTGTVADPTGAVVPKAEMKLVNGPDQFGNHKRFRRFHLSQPLAGQLPSDFHG
jgi:hypothetical protein